jgi:hypothetical protein
MGVSYPTKAQTKGSTPDGDIEANIPQTGTEANGNNNLQEVDEDRGEEAARRVIIWAPILCIAILVLIGVLGWGLHEVFKPSS